MAHVKTAISIQDSLFKQVEELARQMRVSRSQLFAMAMEAFLQQYENQQLVERLNQAYSDKPDAAEQAYLAQMKHKYRQRLEVDEQW
jgi:metal-responsive CopG/Arc/MetJ family transcriptional regulator